MSLKSAILGGIDVSWFHDKSLQYRNQNENKIYHTIRTVSKLKRNITETNKIDISNTFIHVQER